MTTLSQGKAQLDLIGLSKEAELLDQTDIFVWLTKAGLPIEVVTRLEDLWSVTKNIAGQVIHLGKIIIFKIIEFIKAHPHTAAGLLVGAAIGSLVGLVPWLGPLLAPLTTVIGATIGAMTGAKLDNAGATTAFEGLIILAKQFFQLLAEIFNVLKDKLAMA